MKNNNLIKITKKITLLILILSFIIPISLFSQKGTKGGANMTIDEARELFAKSLAKEINSNVEFKATVLKKVFERFNNDTEACNFEERKSKRYICPRFTKQTSWRK